MSRSLAGAHRSPHFASRLIIHHKHSWCGILIWNECQADHFWGPFFCLYPPLLSDWTCRSLFFLLCRKLIVPLYVVVLLCTWELWLECLLDNYVRWNMWVCVWGLQGHFLALQVVKIPHNLNSMWLFKFLFCCKIIAKLPQNQVLNIDV